MTVRISVPYLEYLIDSPFYTPASSVAFISHDFGQPIAEVDGKYYRCIIEDSKEPDCPQTLLPWTEVYVDFGNLQKINKVTLVVHAKSKLAGVTKPENAVMCMGNGVDPAPDEILNRILKTDDDSKVTCKECKDHLIEWYMDYRRGPTTE